MGRIGKIFAASVALWATALSQSAVIDLTKSNFDDVVLKSGIPSLVEFYAPWCGHCKNLAPIYEELATSFEYAKKKVNIARVDADSETELGEDYDIKGFPTLVWFDGNGKKRDREQYNDGRDLEALTNFITDKTGLRPKTKVAPSDVEMLTDATWSERIGGEKDALVAFTAPWCGHCKSLAPEWEKLAHDFAAETGVLIAKVDCDSPAAKATKQREDVSAYPTIKFYPKGSSVAEEYVGDRKLSDLITFMNEKAGTHRTAGGGLDALAGTIPSLDTIVATLKTGGEEAYKNLEKAAAALQGKYAEYYAKVAKKTEANAGYVDKELARLQGLLKKGGMALEKVDDLTERSNILRKFKEEVERIKDEL